MKIWETCESNENMEKFMRKCWARFDDDKKKYIQLNDSVDESGPKMVESLVPSTKCELQCPSVDRK
jgi:hypothetical protein